MPRLTIDNQQVEMPEGATLLDAARKLRINIPTLCFLDGRPPLTSCMACVVKVAGRAGLMPACATRAEEGMRVESGTPEVHAARRAALELMLSDHLGDCMGPCQCICPAGMDIPLMIRQIAAGKMREAIATVKRHIALPAALGRICPAPCEKGCRRGDHDGAVSIMLLKRYVADVDLAGEEPYLPPRNPGTGKRVGIVGAGPAGLAAAYYLLQLGHEATLFDDHDQPGGMLRYGVDEDRLPRELLDAEIAVIERLGAAFRLGTRVGRDVPMAQVRRDFDAVMVAAGELREPDAERLDLAAEKDCIKADSRTCQTDTPGVFAGGDAVRRARVAVRAVADGRTAAVAIDQHLRGQKVTGKPRPFNIRIGKLKEGEIERFLAAASPAGRVEPPAGAGVTSDQAQTEAARCLHCDCRKAHDCKLRIHAQAYQAKPTRYRGQRRGFQQQAEHPDVIYEPGKCITCGLCVQITAAAAEPLGLTFIGRGFNVRVAVPFDESIAEGLQKVAAECVEACPTGALAFKSGPLAR